MPFWIQTANGLINLDHFTQVVLAPVEQSDDDRIGGKKPNYRLRGVLRGNGLVYEEDLSEDLDEVEAGEKLLALATSLGAEATKVLDARDLLKKNEGGRR